MRLLVLLLLCVVGCDDSTPEPSEPAAELEVAEAETEPQQEPEPELEPPALRQDLGWTEPPPAPSDNARRLNKRALGQHRRGRYEESLQGFRAALAAHETYSNARFNAACALAKLDRLDEAANEVEALFLTDLPTYGPRYASDDDFAELRTSSQGRRLDAFRDLMLRSYEAVMYAGPALVFNRPEELKAEDDEGDERSIRRKWAQAGVWVQATRRFVPMGPAVFVDANYGTSPELQLRFSRSSRRVVAGSALDYQSDMGYIGEVYLRVFSAPDGVELGSARPRISMEDDEIPATSFALVSEAGGVRWETGQHRGVIADGRPPRPAPESPPVPVDDFTFDQARARLTIGEGESARVVRLGGAHRPNRHMNDDTHLLRLGDDAILVLTTREIGSLDGMMTGPWVLSRVERSSGDVRRLFHGEEGSPRMTAAPDGTVYFESDRQMRTIPPSGDPELLPEGLWVGVL